MYNPSPRLASIPKNPNGRYYEALLRDAKIAAHACPFYWVAQDDHQHKDIYVQLCFQIDWGRRRCSSSDYATFRSRVLHAHKQSDARLFTEIKKMIRQRKKTSCKPMCVQSGRIEEDNPYDCANVFDTKEVGRRILVRLR